MSAHWGYHLTGWAVHSYDRYYWLAQYADGKQRQYLPTPTGNVRRFRSYERAAQTARRLNNRAGVTGHPYGE